MDNLTTCQILQASERASDMRKNFICAQDSMHQAMLETPWPILFYAASVLFIMYLVQRAANVPHRTPEYEAKKKANDAVNDGSKDGSGTPKD